jgi:ABC-2 type transport system permease protein
MSSPRQLGSGNMIDRVRTVIEHELRILGTDKWAYVTLIAMPLVLVVFLSPAMRFVLEGQGFHGASGADQAVPGMAVLFAFFVVGNVGFAFFRDYGFKTWDRLRATGTSLGELVCGRFIPYVAIVFLQQVVLFGCGLLFFDLRVKGPYVALACTAVALSCCVVAIGLLVMAVSSTEQQILSFQAIGTMVLAGIGGALTPVAILPAWVRFIAHGTPSYWAMRAYQGVILDGDGLTQIALPLVLLFAISLVVGVAAVFVVGKRDTPVVAAI